MSFNWQSYQEWATTKANSDLSEELLRDNWALGLCGEAGEVCDLLKKVAFHDHKLDTKKLMHEVGDCLFYSAQAMRSFGYPFSIDETGPTKYNITTTTRLAIIFVAYMAVSADLVLFCETYNRDSELPKAIYLGLNILKEIANRYGFTLEDAAIANMEKVNARHPQGFDPVHAAVVKNTEDL